MIENRPYQQEGLDAIVAAELRGIRRPLLALPTGTGKTVVFAHLIKQRPGRSIILVHRDELVWQAVDKLQIIAPDLPVGIVKAARDEVRMPCLVASVQTVSREARLARLTPDFTTVVIDEAHHAVAESYRRVLTALRAFEDDGPLTLGVTATPMRGDDVGLEAVFQEIVYQKSILEMIVAGYLCDLRAIQIHLEADFHALHTRAGDLIEGELDDMLMDADAPEYVTRAYREHALGRKALLFTPTIATAHVMAATLRAAGIAAEALSGETPLDDRQAMLRRLKSGKTQVIANCAVLTEGFDEPSVDCIIVARPTKSPTLYTQMIGRGTRLYPGKEACLILDLVGVTTRHDLMSLASLTGLPLEYLIKGQSVLDAMDAQAAEQQRVYGEMVARRVELFRRRPLHWLPSEARFVLSLGEQGWMVLTPEAADQDRWTVSRVSPRGVRRVIAAQVLLSYAQGIAEDHAQREGAGGLVNPRARWRQRPVEESEKVLTWLQRWHLPYRVGMSLGEASDLLTLERLRRLHPGGKVRP
jgi:superfamily II DNA or RNA helicase